MIVGIAYHIVLGLPVFAWFGAAATLMFVAAFFIIVWNGFSEKRLLFSWHRIFAAAGLVFMSVHVLLFIFGR